MYSDNKCMIKRLENGYIQNPMLHEYINSGIFKNSPRSFNSSNVQQEHLEKQK